jgi:hypothetical protein
MEEAERLLRTEEWVMNEYLMLEIARQRIAERQESARISRLARDQRTAERYEHGRDGKVRGVSARGDELVGLPPIPDYVDGTFAKDRGPTSAGPTAARR